MSAACPVVVLSEKEGGGKGWVARGPGALHYKSLGRREGNILRVGEALTKSRKSEADWGGAMMNAVVEK